MEAFSLTPGEGGISYGEKLGPAKPCPGNAWEPGAESSDLRSPLGAAAAGKPAGGATTGSCWPGCDGDS